MNSAEQESLQSQLTLLEGRLRRTERWVQFHKIGWILFAVLVLLLIEINPFGVVRAQLQQPQKLRLRELDIVDEKGRERIVIAAPLPEKQSWMAKLGTGFEWSPRQYSSNL